MPFSSRPSPWRTLLRPLGWLYGSGAAVHRWWHRRGQRPRSGPPALLVVGNLSVGGTGKTPHVAQVYRWLAEDYALAIVSRGYGRTQRGVRRVTADAWPSAVGDEPLELQRQLPDALVVVAERRLEGVARALELRPDLSAVVLDDALQHWALQPDLSILLTTFEAPFFDDAVLPAGRLREFKGGYRRADIIVVTKCPADLTEAQRRYFRSRIQPLPHQSVFFSRYVYALPRALFGAPAPDAWTHWQTQSILLVTALADTQYLETFVRRHSQQLHVRRYPDHHAYTAADLRHIATLAPSRSIWITEKDAVKWMALLPTVEALGLEVYVLPIAVHIEEAARLQARLRLAMDQKNAHPQAADEH